MPLIFVYGEAICNKILLIFQQWNADIINAAVNLLGTHKWNNQTGAKL